jgi:hypothetical protein
MEDATADSGATTAAAEIIPEFLRTSRLDQRDLPKSDTTLTFLDTLLVLELIVRNLDGGDAVNLDQ